MKRTTTPKTKTRVILGIKLRLKVGQRYVASRPMRLDFHRPFPIDIWKIESRLVGKPVYHLGPFTKEFADRFLGAFNNGKISFSGRKWK